MLYIAPLKIKAPLKIIQETYLPGQIGLGKRVKREVRSMLALATKVLNDYSKMLANIEPGNLGFAESFLPHSKTAIREATKSALSHLGAGQPVLREALIRGYVYLEQFVTDAQAETLLAAAIPGADVATQGGTEAAEIVIDIKLRMAQALKEISAFAGGSN